MAAVLLACLVLSAPTRASVDLTWKPKVGQTTRYRSQLSYDPTLGGEKHTIKIVTINVIQVKGVGESRVTSIGQTEEYRATVDGNERVLVGRGEGQQVPAQTLIDDLKSGERVSVERQPSDKSQGYPRAESLTVFRRPAKLVDVGATWSVDVLVEDNGVKIPAKEDFTVIGAESASGRRCWKIRFKYTEMGRADQMSSSGDFWIDQDDGKVVKLVASHKNIRFTSSGPKADAEFTLELI